MDIEHPDISRIERDGYPDKEWLQWEREKSEEAEEEIWPDGLSWLEWQKEKANRTNG